MPVQPSAAPLRSLCLTLAASLVLTPTALAQAKKDGSSTKQGSSTTGTLASGTPALSGYCPVCVIEMKKWVRGNPAIQASFDGRTYYFPGEEQKQTFVTNPEKYAPVLGGDCAVCLTDMRKRAPGSVHHAAISENRLFLFPNAEIKEKFRLNPQMYNHADLALGGNCAVCRVEMNQDVPGNPETSLIYSGMRFQFPGDEQRKMFIANPDKYVGAAGSSAGSSTKDSKTK